MPNMRSKVRRKTKRAGDPAPVGPPKSDIVFHNERRKVSELVPYERNPRKMSEKEAADLTRSIQKFDLADIPIVQPSGKLIGGHQRVSVLKTLGRGDEEIDVRVPNRELNHKEYEELLLRLNKNTGQWDWDQLPNFDLNLLLESGFTKEELSHKFTIDLFEDEFDAKAEYDKITEAKAKRGDIYQLGRHRLMCGDSCDAKDVEKLMDGKKADMIFTDPPYGVNYSYTKYIAIHGDRKKSFIDKGKIFNDNKDEIGQYNFILDSLSLVYEYSKPSAAIYCCYATKQEIAFQTAFRDAGWLFSQTIIWLKERIILAMGQDYHRCYEPILFGWKKGNKHYADRHESTSKEVWDLDRKTFEERLDLWYISRDKSKDYIHPTQKPVKLIERALKKSSKLDDLLYEPFAGSFSTGIACEQGGRSCYAMELDPKYVDVAILRWEQFTKQKAVML